MTKTAEQIAGTKCRILNYVLISNSSLHLQVAYWFRILILRQK